MGKHYRHGIDPLPTKEWAEKHIIYYPIEGRFIWRFGGKEAGRSSGRYREICIKNVIYKASKLAWLIMTGEWPTMIVDHINRRSGDDRWENLRLATNTQNQANKDVYGNAHGFKGVSASKNKFKAEIRIDGRKVYLGTFDTPEEAGAAYNEKAKEIYGEFAV